MPVQSAGDSQVSGLRWERGLLAGILLLGLLLRLWYFSENQHSPDFQFPQLDGFYHHHMAKGLATGDWSIHVPFAEDPKIQSTPYFRPPGYSWFLSVIYRVSGVNFFVSRGIQLVLGLLNCWLIWRLGRKWFGAGAGLLAALFLATDWVSIFFEGELMEPVLMTFGSLVLIHLLGRLQHNPHVGSSLLAGLWLGACALVRSNILLFAPFAAAWVLWVLKRRGISRSRIALSLFAIAAGCFLIIAPAGIRNYRASGEFFLISCNGPITFLYGNNERANGRSCTFPGIEELMGSDGMTPMRYPRLVESLGRKLGRTISYQEAGDYWKQQAFHFIRNRFAEFVSLTCNKALLFISPVEVSIIKEAHSAWKTSAALARLPAYFPWILAGSFIGIGCFAFQLRRSSRIQPLEDSSARLECFVLLMGFVFIYSLSIIPFVVESRLRMPVVPLLMLFASAGPLHLWYFLRNNEYARFITLLFVFIALFLAFSRNWTGYRPDRAKWHFDRAMAWEQQSRPEKAVEEYQLALKADADHVQSTVNLASHLITAGRLEEAERLNLHVLQLKPAQLEAVHNLGMIELKKNNPGNAAARFVAVIEKHPGHAEAWSNLASAAIMQGDYSRALEACQNALKFQQNFPDAWNNLGLAQWKLGDSKSALESLQMAIRQNPAHVEAHYNLGNVLQIIGRPEEALAEFQRAIELSPAHFRARNNLAILFAANGRYSEAIEQYELAIQTNPDFADTHNNLGVSLLAAKNPTEAIKSFEKAIQLKPDYADAYFNLALAYAQTGNIPQAVDHMSRVLQIDPQYPDAARNREILLRKM